MAVTPYTGVWIETEKPVFNVRFAVVTPYTGVWIETMNNPSFVSQDQKSHPTRVCGLKPGNEIIRAFISEVTPYTGVWIETCEKYGCAKEC